MRKGYKDFTTDVVSGGRCSVIYKDVAADAARFKRAIVREGYKDFTTDVVSGGRCSIIYKDAAADAAQGRRRNISYKGFITDVFQND